jgi:hypothetical protein
VHIAPKDPAATITAASRIASLNFTSLISIVPVCLIHRGELPLWENVHGGEGEPK